MAPPSNSLSKHRRPRKQILQDSPFLRLPYDIRILIYRAALIRPTPIDLWPRTYISNPESDPALAPRIAKSLESTFYHDHRDNCPHPFRQQADLHYVRTEMATGLLATCTQIWHEAAAIYWRGNTFRFSNDMEWYGVRRFLGSIGPRAVAQLKTLEVFAPLLESRCLDTSAIDGGDVDRRVALYASNREAKNHPKMHMVKAAKEPWKGTFWRVPNHMMLTGEEIHLGRNVEHVFYLLREAEAELELRLVVPEGFAVNSAGQNRNWFSRTRTMAGIEEACFPEQLLRDREYHAISMTLVVEAGAYFSVDDVPTRITSQGINVLCQPGSLMQHGVVPTLFDAVELTAPRSWVDPASEFDYLVGLVPLFDETFPDMLAIPAHGGRTSKTSGPRKMERVLRGFGGCRFVLREGWICSDCGGAHVQRGTKTGMEWLHSCRHCRQIRGGFRRNVLEVRNIARAIKQGHINGNTQAYNW